MLEEVFLSRTYADWEKRLRENNLMYGPILSPLDVATDPQALANDFFAEVEQPDIGRIKLINMPIKFCQNPAKVRSPAPLLGQHTEEVLLSLGYSSQKISQLRKEQVIA
jgi:crotonobetainyl-CoA:carnitine CoA-transferase CaiB-like acyl-CoA transferase